MEEASEEGCTLGLVERTVPLALPYMCSTGPSLDCWAAGGEERGKMESERSAVVIEG